MSIPVPWTILQLISYNNRFFFKHHACKIVGILYNHLYGHIISVNDPTTFSLPVVTSIEPVCQSFVWKNWSTHCFDAPAYIWSWVASIWGRCIGGITQRSLQVAMLKSRFKPVATLLKYTMVAAPMYVYISGRKRHKVIKWATKNASDPRPKVCNSLNRHYCSIEEFWEQPWYCHEKYELLVYQANHVKILFLGPISRYRWKIHLFFSSFKYDLPDTVTCVQ